MSLYNDMSTVILAGGYKLDDILHRIDVIYINGKLSDEERSDLYDLAREHANPEESFDPFLERLEELETWRKTVDADIAALKAGTAEPYPEPSDEYPEYVQPTGAHNAYYNGDKVTWDGEHYICIAPAETPVVWNPNTYPSYWQKVNE